ncbi:hypothetical protein OAE19_05135 [Porticoccaceae bacterium]|nr:hypothetical protein [Porticoccaceae bacterium]
MPTNLAIARPFNPNLTTIEEYLLELEKYGKPHLSKMDHGWNARIDVFVTGEGVTFKALSEFECPAPKDALAQCYERLNTALNKIKPGNQSP